MAFYKKNNRVQIRGCTRQIKNQRESPTINISFINSARNICSSRVNQKFHQTLRDLKKDPSIKVCTMDKGKGRVVLNSKDYFEKLDIIIHDTTKQVDGVTMGSPLGPTMANFCLPYFENELLNTIQDTNKPALYLRYVDDIFCEFKQGQQHEPLLQLLNNMHKSLRFTVEIGGKSLAFLDTVITLPNNENEKFCSQVYRKPTYSILAYF